MPYASIRDFIARLEREQRLVRVREPVSTVLEMTEIQTRLLAEGGPAVIFENPIKADGTRSEMPVLVNLFGTVKRVAMGVACAKWVSFWRNCVSRNRRAASPKPWTCCRWRRPQCR